jgi:hypothetical protein
MGLRATLHEVGAKLLQHILQYDEPAPDRRQLPCSCGQQARYVGITSPDSAYRPTICAIPAEQACSRSINKPDAEQTKYSPEVRRMLALVGRL